MKAVVCKEFGPIENLVIEEIPSPPIEPGKDRIATELASIGFMDTLMVRGLYQMKPPRPFVAGGVGAGVVMEVGPGVESVRVGDRATFMNFYGAFAEEIVTSEGSVMVFPPSFDLEEAVTTRLSFQPVYFALARRANLQAGEVILVTGASGGVGHAAIKMAKAMGARVIGSIGREEKRAFVQQCGADEVINHQTENLRDRVLELTEGKGVDVVLDTVGGEVFMQCLRAINMFGRLVVMGFTSGTIPNIPANRVLLKNCSVMGVFLGGFMTRDPQGFRRLNGELLEFLIRHGLKAHVSHRFPMEQVVHGMQTLLGRATVGKLTLTIR